MEVARERIRAVLTSADTPEARLAGLRRLAEEQAAAILRERSGVCLIVLIGSVARELSGDRPLGSAVWEDTDLDIWAWERTELDALYAHWQHEPPHWLSGAIALYDPDNLLPGLLAECSHWRVPERRKLVRYLWMQNLAIKRSALLFLGQGNLPAALWAARKAFELVLDIRMLLDGEMPATPKYDWYVLPADARELLVRLHTVDSGDAGAVDRVVHEADDMHWRLKHEIEAFIGSQDIFAAPWDAVRFPIIRWL